MTHVFSGFYVYSHLTTYHLNVGVQNVVVLDEHRGTLLNNVGPRNVTVEWWELKWMW